jgi:hypothetical protein
LLLKLLLGVAFEVIQWGILYIMKKIVALLIAIIGFSIIAFSQTYTMSNSTVTTCSGTFYDPGGTGNYANNQNVTMTFCSGNGQSVLLQFSQFALENNWDYLYI